MIVCCLFRPMAKAPWSAFEGSPPKESPAAGEFVGSEKPVTSFPLGDLHCADRTAVICGEHHGGLSTFKARPCRNSGKCRSSMSIVDGRSRGVPDEAVEGGRESWRRLKTRVSVLSLR